MRHHSVLPRPVRPEHIRLICLDEAHRSESTTYQKLLALYPNAGVVGLTATPVRGDGKGLGRTFSALVQPITTRALMERGYLVPPRYFIPSELDLIAAREGRRGDFTQAELDAIADSNPQLIGDVVETFARVCPERRAVAFPCNIRHSLALRDAFNSVGIPAVHIDGHTPREERRDLMAAFRAGEYQILTSVNIAIEGLDVPDVSAVILARPTRSERIWIQAVGRGLRTSSGKADCIVLDHAGVMLSLGPAEDYQDWTLGADRGQTTTPRKPRKKRDRKEITCEECHAVFYVGTVTTLPAGSHATVENCGTGAAAVLNFGIPQDAPGTGGTSPVPLSAQDAVRASVGTLAAANPSGNWKLIGANYQALTTLRFDEVRITVKIGNTVQPVTLRVRDSDAAGNRGGILATATITPGAANEIAVRTVRLSGFVEHTAGQRLIVEVEVASDSNVTLGTSGGMATQAQRTTSTLYNFGGLYGNGGTVNIYTEGATNSLIPVELRTSEAFSEWVLGPLGPVDMPKVSTQAQLDALPIGAQALSVITLPPRWVHRHTNGALYYGPVYSTTP